MSVKNYLKSTINSNDEVIKNLRIEVGKLEQVIKTIEDYHSFSIENSSLVVEHNKTRGGISVFITSNGIRSNNYFAFHYCPWEDSFKSVKLSEILDQRLFIESLQKVVSLKDSKIDLNILKMQIKALEQCNETIRATITECSFAE